MADIKLYGFAQSSYTWSARIAAEEKGITHELIDIEFGSESHRALHPFAKIPAMQHGDFVLYETSAISRYIDETFDGPALQPDDTKARALMDQWISAYNDNIYPAVAKQIVIQRIVIPRQGGETDEAVVKEGAEKAAYQMAVLEKALSQSEYLAGDSFSIADMIAAPILWYLEKLPEGEMLYAKTTAVNAWRKRIEARPSFAATIPPMLQQEAAE